MKKVYIVRKDDYSDTPIMAFDNYNDAVHAAASLSGKSETANKLVLSLPYFTNEPISIDTKDLQSVIDMTIKATTCAFESVKKTDEPD
jgi:hypothetical protein